MGLLKKIFKNNKKGKKDNNNMGQCQSSTAAATSKKSTTPTSAAAAASKQTSVAPPPSKPPLAPTSSSSPSHASKEAISAAGQQPNDHQRATSGGSSNLAESTTDDSTGSGGKQQQHNRFASYASGASTPDVHSDDENNDSDRSHHSSGSMGRRNSSNPKLLLKSASAIGLDEMIEDRRNDGDLRQNVVHIEVPFGKPIEEVYEGVHSGPVLGSGISGLVRLVTHKATSLKYAVKVLDLGLVETSEGLQQLREEIFIMCQLDHPNIVRLEEVYESQSEIYLVQELCLGGELFDRLDEQPDYHYTEGECARLVKQMLSAVRYLHSRGIIHRDLKLENFLFSSTSTDSELKMIDFGLSKHFRYGEVQHEAVGTPYTVAPEVIRGSYDERCDIWAIGVITFLLLSGDPPFGGCGGPEPLMTVRSNILKGAFDFEPEDIWANVSGLAREFIRDMLKTDPKDRPTARAAQKHMWLQEWASRSRKGEDNVLNPNVVKALVNFKEFSDMRKLLCEVLSFTLLPYQIKELRREFEKMDTDGSGEISLAALKQVLLTNAGAGALGALTEEEVEDIFNAMRVRKSEARIHWHEFIAAGLSQCQVDDRNLRLAFDRLDSDHKGYIILDDIMDLLGSDANQSEEEMHQMWGDSVKAVKGQHARITYDNFLLLMKGQTKEKEVPSQELEQKLSQSMSGLMGSSTRLEAVPETASAFADSPKRDEVARTITLPSGDIVTMDGSITPVGGDNMEPTKSIGDSDHTPNGGHAVIHPSQSAPTTPADHRRILDLEIESPLSMDEDGDIMTSGPGVPGSAASLTPPMSPSRGAEDYVTPMGRRLMVVDFKDSGGNLALPGLPPGGTGLAKPLPYVRGRSRSVGDSTEGEDEEAKQLQEVAEAVRDLMLPETDHRHAKKGVVEQNKSALVVNRQLYRAHRQMRLAVLEASKRFEEQQANHAREVLMAEHLNDEGGMIQAGLVMRHGHKKQISSQAIRTLLDQNRVQQQALVEKANRRGGRGRRSRKKTISDMSGMMTSLGSEDMSAIAKKAAASAENEGEANGEASGNDKQYVDMDEAGTEGGEAGPDLPDLAEKGPLREPTVPGEFRKTSDPFGKRGRYGAVTQFSP